MRKQTYNLLAILFIILTIIQLTAAIIENEYDTLLNFCFILAIIFIIALFKKNDFLFSTIVTASFFINTLWLIDMTSFLIFNKLTIGVGEYLFEATTIRFISTFYHLFILTIPLIVVFDRAKFHKYSWLGASLFLFVTLAISSLFTNMSLNCSRGDCAVGIFTPVQNYLVSI